MQFVITIVTEPIYIAVIDLLTCGASDCSYSEVAILTFHHIVFQCLLLYCDLWNIEDLAIHCFIIIMFYS